MFVISTGQSFFSSHRRVNNSAGNRHQDILGTIYGMALSAALATIAGTLLYRTTRNYFRFRGNASEKLDDEDDEWVENNEREGGSA